MGAQHVAIVGSGPVGMTTALLLARQGHRITLVDRDPGPRSGQEWRRLGVMQFHLPHALRALGRGILAERLPDLDQALQDAGGELTAGRGAPPFMLDMHIRRSVMERVMWELTSRAPGIERVTGHVDEIATDGRRATGVVVDGVLVPADVVVDASGRAGKVSGTLRPPRSGGDCGFAYAARLYRLRPGAEPGPLNGGPGYISEHPGFLQLIFTHDAGTFTVLIVRASGDHELADLRHEAVFTAAMRGLPGAGEWTAPERGEPIDAVRAGANLTNTYRPQAGVVTGLVAVGDSASTTNPAGARGISLGIQTAAQLADIAAAHPVSEWASRLEEWTEANLRPWFEEHVISDAWQLRTWDGLSPDPDGPIPWNLVVAATREHPEWRDTVGPFLGMVFGPRVLDPLREQVRDMLRNGWSPPPPEGPDRSVLVAAAQGALAPAG